MERNIFDYVNVSQMIWENIQEKRDFSNIDEEELSRV